jgi:hypothetical protein
LIISKALQVNTQLDQESSLKKDEAKKEKKKQVPKRKPKK